MIRSTLLALLLLVVLFASGPAGAVPTTFTDRSAWETAVGPAILFLEDFNGVASDTSFSTSPVDVGAFTIEQFGGLPLASSNLIDVSPFIAPSQTVNGSTFVRGFVNSDNSQALQTFIRITFDVPVFAWGADFFSPDSDEGLEFLLIDQQSGQTLVSGPTADGFFGFVDPAELYTQLVILPRIRTTGGELFGMDDATGAQIPEPTPGSLVALGLVALAASRRRWP
jgi:MYXO-CTERM domain-containing protein